MDDFLRTIVERKSVEVRRRRRFASAAGALTRAPIRGDSVEVLRRRAGQAPRVLAEIKFKSPSAGMLRARAPHDVARIARQYVNAGASALSVLADGPGFGGSVLDVRRAARAVPAPVLFKEFVLDEVQIDFARAAGASMVLLLANVLTDRDLERLSAKIRAEGMEPLLEVSNELELERALRTSTVLVGINARDLKTFRVDPARARALIAAVPPDRVAVYMSGVATVEDFSEVASGRADAVLIGEALMRAPDPGAWLRESLLRT